MDKIRIGKDIKIRWKVNLNDRPVTADDNLTLIMVNPRLQLMKLDYIIEDGTVISTFRGSEQLYTGKYKLTLWFNYGEENQTALDESEAFTLVKFTDREYEDTEVTETTVDLTGKVTISGASAYEIWLANGNSGTQQDFLYSLKGSVDETVLQDIQNKLNILYKADVTFSGGKNVKKGTTATGNLTWTVKVNGTAVDPINQTLNGETLANNIRSYTYSGITSNTTFTLIVDGVTKYAYVRFYNPVYYGSVSSDYIISDNVTGLSELTSNYGSRNNNITVNANGNMKFVYLYPSAFGSLTSIKDGNNFEYINDFTKVAGISINNENYIGYILNKEANINGLIFKFS